MSCLATSDVSETGVFDHPVVWGIAVGVLSVFVAAPIIIETLRRTRRIDDDLRRDLFGRYVPWLGIVPMMFIPVLLGRVWTAAGAGLLALACFLEFARATRLLEHRTFCGVIAGGLGLATFATIDHWPELFGAVLILTFCALMITALLADDPPTYTRRVGLGALALLLFGASLGHIGLLANHPQGCAILLLILVCIESNDIFAYISGKTFGAHKLAPKTSPNKTIEGSVGAVVLTSMLFSSIASTGFGDPGLGTWIQMIGLGMLLSMVGQCGDLLMSSIKRDLGIKDMGSILGGHGGLLDRFDSLLLAAPVAYYYLRAIGGHEITSIPERVFSGR